MDEAADNSRPEDGFEWNGRFYRWRVSDRGKDLLLIDRIAQMPVQEFFELVEDAFDRTRAPVLLAMIATSIRAEHPQWSHQRIERIVMGLSLSEDIAFVDGDVADPEEEAGPPASGGQEPPSTPSTSPSDASSPSSTPAESSEPETLYATPA